MYMHVYCLMHVVFSLHHSLGAMIPSLIPRLSLAPTENKNGGLGTRLCILFQYCSVTHKRDLFNHNELPVPHVFG